MHARDTSDTFQYGGEPEHGLVRVLVRFARAVKALREPRVGHSVGPLRQHVIT